MFRRSNLLNIDDINAIILKLAEEFPHVVEEEFNIRGLDPYEYYTKGHCASFAYLLYVIFNGNCELLASDSHAIVKINGNYYDITGNIIVNENINDPEFKIVDPTYIHFLGEFVFQSNKMDETINEKLIEIGIHEKDKILDEKKNEQNYAHIFKLKRSKA